MPGSLALERIFMDNNEMKTRLAALLLEKSYREGSFTLASGRHSEYYFDCKPTALHPEGGWLLGTIFNGLLSDQDICGVGGMTLGADPLVSAISVLSYDTARPLCAFIVRKQPKGHGTQQYIEGLGNFKPGDRVALIEDVVTTGGTLLTTCQRVKDAGLVIATIASVLDREEGGREALSQAGYPLRAIFTRKEMIEYGKKIGRTPIKAM